MKKPLVTVTVPAYNHEMYVEQTIMSIVNQTYGYENIELIVVDDCSKDHTADILETLSIKYHFKFIRNERNQGVVKNSNLLRKQAHGKYIAGCASDDYWHPEKLERMVSYMETLDEKIGVCHCAAQIVDEAGNKLYVNDKGKTFVGNIFPRILIDNKIVAPSTLIRSKVYQTVGYYDENIAFEDRDMWIRIGQAFEFAYIDEPLVYRRICESNLSRNYEMNYKVASVLFEKYKDLYEEYGCVDNFNYRMFCSMAGYDSSLAVKHLARCRRYALSQHNFQPFIKLLLPRFVLTSSGFLFLRKLLKNWN